MAQTSASTRFWLNEGGGGDLSRRFAMAVAGSLALHVGLLAVAAWIQLPQRIERPLASIEVTLAPEPSKRSQAADPPKRQVSNTVEPPPPPTRSKAGPVRAPVAPVKVPTGDVIKNVELAPDAPKFGDLSPAQRPAKKPFKLPDVPAVSEVREAARDVPGIKSQPSLAEELSKELDQELRKIRTFELPKLPPPESSLNPMPQVEAKAPSIKAVEAALKISGTAPGSNAYLARVRQRISSFWNAPPVDVADRAYVVIVRFRLHRNGSITGVEIERSSGNEYYDLAGKRAVISANPLPAFPPELTDPYWDAHFTFTVGGTEG